MKTPKAIRTSQLVRWHRLLLWLGGITLLIFALTGVTHPIMSWTGPQAITMRPPTLSLTQAELSQAMQRLQQSQLTAQSLVKLVPYRQQVLLQLTSDLQNPRQYLSLNDEASAISDQQMAIWLASYYAGLPEQQVQSSRILTEFNSAYPSVNRLLPVWQVDFDNGLSLYLHTETLSLAGITNPYKTTLQALFRQLHSWQWLDRVPLLKALVMTLLLGSALLLVLTGGWLLLRLPFQAKRRGLRRWHYLLSWLLVLPVTLYLLTGIYHFAYKYVKPDTLGLTASSAQPLPDNWQLPANALPADAVLNSASLVQGPASHWYWRLSLSNPAQQADRHSRFDGQASERGAIYISVLPDAPALDDASYALLLAERFIGLKPAAISEQQLVQRFGPDYDFRNKRLPVWQLDYADGRIFVDAISGHLVEQQSRNSRWERYSFSYIHKWGLLQPLLGREGRDQVVVAMMLLVLLMAGMGFAMRLTRR
ncbi:PepSY domain-containing protein [Alkalimonas sp.]|uniref:PepSY domain-containing protein n=1 Tax=Alkalimonas sp. TaxID=1872453 RepID=UPI00263BD77C|nr:PepSY domain-containing protein [Alkalimonas sp.]MCC5826175.1 PepSY domain-containing protein [Alkalimonas sp.]